MILTYSTSKNYGVLDVAVSQRLSSSVRRTSTFVCLDVAFFHI